MADLVHSKDLLAPGILKIHEFMEMMTSLPDIMIVLKAISIVIVLSIFEYHALIGRSVDFIQKYPNLYARLDKKTYQRSKLLYIGVPFMDIFFFYKVLRHRYTTVAFLKSFGLPKDT